VLYQKRFDLATVDTDFYVDGATGDLAAGIELESNGPPPDGLAHQLSFVSSGDIGSAVLVVSGLDADGNAISESVTGVTTSPVETTRYFSRVDSITSADDISAETVDVGFVDEAVGPLLHLNWRGNAPARVFYAESGTLEVDIQQTLADPGLYDEQEDIPYTLAVQTGLDDIQNNEYFEVPAGVVALRPKVNSYSTNAEFTLYVTQPEQLA
jgi:hypothetical protein